MFRNNGRHYGSFEYSSRYAIQNDHKKFWKRKCPIGSDGRTEAIDFIKTNIAAGRIDCEFEDASAYLFSQTKDQTEELDEIYEACQEVGLDITYSLAVPVNVQFEKAIEVRGQAKFHPVKYVYALARAFEKAGGVILQHTRVNGVEDTDGITLQTDSGISGQPISCMPHIFLQA
jgi:glycine/D-amino acid oxidase-like deaminating enzyme